MMRKGYHSGECDDLAMCQHCAEMTKNPPWCDEHDKFFEECRECGNWHCPGCGCACQAGREEGDGAMSEQLYKPGDMVTLEEHSGCFSMETVTITKAELLNGVWVYEFVIPEQRGSTPQHLIRSLVCSGMKVPKYKETEWVQP